IAVLEGGYDLEGVGSGMAAVTNVFMHTAPSVSVAHELPILGGVRAAMDATASAHAPWAQWAKRWPSAKSVA
ncbi:MAG TPA: hypothetical protein PLF40_16265, partial [Kofleriaceae bacterium]|nr:hypothetical protein [Kofleriaceae bacterium]